MTRRILKLTDKRKTELKLATIAYLKTLYSKVTPNLEAQLLQDGALNPRAKPKGYFLLEPADLVFEAHYLATGFAKFYSIDEKTGQEKIFFVWEAGTIIVMYEEFRANLPIGDYYIELMREAEQVSITNFCMEGIYAQHTEAYELTQKILTKKKKRMLLQMDILLTPDKTERYKMFVRYFPELAAVMSRKEICAFTGIGLSTLGDSKSGED